MLHDKKFVSDLLLLMTIVWADLSWLISLNFNNKELWLLLKPSFIYKLKDSMFKNIKSFYLNFKICKSILTKRFSYHLKNYQKNNFFCIFKGKIYFKRINNNWKKLRSPRDTFTRLFKKLSNGENYLIIKKWA